MLQRSIQWRAGNREQPCPESLLPQAGNLTTYIIESHLTDQNGRQLVRLIRRDEFNHNPRQAWILAMEGVVSESWSDRPQTPPWRLGRPEQGDRHAA